MTAPFVRDPQPYADALIRYVEDGAPDPTSILAVALRAALFECAEVQQVALNGMQVESPSFRLDCASRIAVANTLIRRIVEALEPLNLAAEVQPR